MRTLGACPRPSLMACGTSVPSGTLNSTDHKDLVIWHVKIEQAVCTGLPASLKMLWSGDQDKVYNPGTRKGWHFTFQQDWWFHQSLEWTWAGIREPSLHSQFLVPSTYLSSYNSTFGVPFFWVQQCHLPAALSKEGKNCWIRSLSSFEESGMWEQLLTAAPWLPESTSIQQLQPIRESSLSGSWEIQGSLSLFCINCSVPDLFNSGSSISSEKV